MASPSSTTPPKGSQETIAPSSLSSTSSCNAQSSLSTFPLHELEDDLGAEDDEEMRGLQKKYKQHQKMFGEFLIIDDVLLKGGRLSDEQTRGIENFLSRCESIVRDCCCDVRRSGRQKKLVVEVLINSFHYSNAFSSRSPSVASSSSPSSSSPRTLLKLPWTGLVDFLSDTGVLVLHKLRLCDALRIQFMAPVPLWELPDGTGATIEPLAKLHGAAAHILSADVEKTYRSVDADVEQIQAHCKDPRMSVLILLKRHVAWCSGVGTSSQVWEHLLSGALPEVSSSSSSSSSSSPSSLWHADVSDPKLRTGLWDLAKFTLLSTMQARRDDSEEAKHSYAGALTTMLNGLCGGIASNGGPLSRPPSSAAEWRDLAPTTDWGALASPMATLLKALLPVPEERAAYWPLPPQAASRPAPSLFPELPRPLLEPCLRLMRVLLDVQALRCCADFPWHAAGESEEELWHADGLVHGREVVGAWLALLQRFLRCKDTEDEIGKEEEEVAASALVHFACFGACSLAGGDRNVLGRRHSWPLAYRRFFVSELAKFFDDDAQCAADPQRLRVEPWPVVHAAPCWAAAQRSQLRNTPAAAGNHGRKLTVAQLLAIACFRPNLPGSWGEADDEDDEDDGGNPSGTLDPCLQLLGGGKKRLLDVLREPWGGKRKRSDHHSGTPASKKKKKSAASAVTTPSVGGNGAAKPATAAPSSTSSDAPPPTVVAKTSASASQHAVAAPPEDSQKSQSVEELLRETNHCKTRLGEMEERNRKEEKELCERIRKIEAHLRNRHHHSNESRRRDV